MQKSSKANRDVVVDEYMDIFKTSYADASNDRRRMVDMQKMFDNVIDEGSWPTTAKLSMPLMMSYVLRNIPHTWQAMFPGRDWVTLMPAEEDVDIEQLKNAEDALNHTLKRRMKLSYKSYPAILDSFKFGVGFGIIEPVLVHPVKSFLNQIIDEKRNVIASARVLGRSAPKRSVRFRYVVPGQIVVTKDGSSFNGDERVSVSFFVDHYSESAFRELMVTENLTGNVEEIIGDARKNVFDASTPVVNTVAQLAGVKMSNKNAGKNFPVRIPVVKCYAEKRHLWIANGKTRIFDLVSEETMRCPLQKASAGQDGQRFYPMNIAEACQKAWYGYNLYISALYDILSYSLNPILAYDKTKAGMNSPQRDSSGLMPTYGPVRDSMGYLSPPTLGADVFNIGDKMLSMIGEVTNRGVEMSPGMVRGGGFALADMMKSSYGQQVMGDTFMSLGFLLPCADQTLALMQEIITEGEDKFTLREYNPESEQEYIKNIVVTEDDLNHSYDVEMNLRSIEGSSSLDMSKRQAEFDRLSRSQFADQYEVISDYIGDPDRAKRLLFTRKKVRELQEAQRLAEIQAGAGASGNGMMPSNEREQALAGAGEAALAIAPEEAM